MGNTMPGDPVTKAAEPAAGAPGSQKGLTKAEAERWLMPSLAYDPAE